MSNQEIGKKAPIPTPIKAFGARAELARDAGLLSPCYRATVLHDS